jgi:hypothetical protein
MMAELPKVEPFGMLGLFLLGVDIFYLTLLNIIATMNIKYVVYRVKHVKRQP